MKQAVTRTRENLAERIDEVISIGKAAWATCRFLQRWAAMLHVLFDLLLRAPLLSNPPAQAFRLPPFAKNAKDGAPTVLWPGF